MIIFKRVSIDWYKSYLTEKNSSCSLFEIFLQEAKRIISFQTKISNNFHCSFIYSYFFISVNLSVLLILSLARRLLSANQREGRVLYIMLTWCSLFSFYIIIYCWRKHPTFGLLLSPAGYSTPPVDFVTFFVTDGRTDGRTDRQTN